QEDSGDRGGDYYGRDRYDDGGDRRDHGGDHYGRDQYEGGGYETSPTTAQRMGGARVGGKPVVMPHPK
ncbi:MAG: hypothetical protein M3Q60_22965, partial [Actinomycetota bacterium]|nr:hypothetical protein [Actinomycetota bacterium]